jgi:hypothetical protein
MNNRDRIFREVIAAIVGSKLRSSELRTFSELLMNDPSFVADLSRLTYEISYGLSKQTEMAWTDEIEISNSSSDGGLTELAYSLIQRRRLSKDRLLMMLRNIAPEISWTTSLKERPMREIVSRFLENSSTSETQQFLNALGMEIEEDPYLGGISSRKKK